MHMGFLIDKMKSDINKLDKYYDFIETFKKAEQPPKTNFSELPDLL